LGGEDPVRVVAVVEAIRYVLPKCAENPRCARAIELALRAALEGIGVPASKGSAIEAAEELLEKFYTFGEDPILIGRSLAQAQQRPITPRARRSPKIAYRERRSLLRPEPASERPDRQLDRSRLHSHGILTVILP